jgi:CBS domain-containing protein
MAGTPNTDVSLQGGDYLAPAFEHARVSDVMRPGLFACAASTPLAGVARIMATNHVHSVAITGVEAAADGVIARRAWGIVSDLDVVRAAGASAETTAGEVAELDVATVHPFTPLSDAAKLMIDRGTAHLIVEDPSTHQPLGVVSSLDIAGNIAWARG